MVNSKAGFGVVLIVLALSQVTSSQVSPRDYLAAPASCEMQIKVIERVMRIAQESDERVFVISRRSSGEKTKVDWARLKYVQAVITQVQGFPKEKLTISAGKVTPQAKGLLEFWVGSNLELELSLTRNRQPCLMSQTLFDR